MTEQERMQLEDDGGPTISDLDWECGHCGEVIDYTINHCPCLDNVPLQLNGLRTNVGDIVCIDLGNNYNSLYD